MRKTGWVLLGLTTLAGCSGKPPAIPAGESAATRPAGDAAWLTLDEIEPRPAMPSPAATTRPAAPPLEAVRLYAQAVAAQLAGQRDGEIASLREALAKDPDSYALRFALGEALSAGSSGNDAALEQFQRAAELEPDHIAVQYEVGRLHLAKGNAARAIEHLRLGLQAGDARKLPAAMARTHLYLAKALQQNGHHLAAIEQYEKLLYHLDRRVNPRVSPELWTYSNRRELIYVQLAELNEKLGRYPEALNWFGKVLERQPGVFAFNEKLVRLLLKMDKHEQARDLAAELVSDNRASSESLALLHDVFRAMGREKAAADELRKIIAKHPGDRSLVYALADALASSGRGEEARQLLTSAVRESGFESSVIYRLFEFHVQRNEVEPAAKLLIDALAARPESVEDLDGLWVRLVKGTMSSRLRLADMEKIAVDEKAAAAKLYWTSRLAGASGKGALAVGSLQKAAEIKPAFAPAYRQLFAVYMGRRDLPEATRIAAVEKLINQAKDQGQIPLATELIGRLLLVQEKPAEAAEVLAKAIELGQRTPNVVCTRAAALSKAKKDDEAETLLWQVTHDHSTYEPAYQMLFRMNNEQRDPREAVRVLQAWLAGNPFSVMANLLQTRILLEGGNRPAAENTLGRLFREEPDNPLVIQALTEFYSSREEELLAKLEEEHKRNRENRAVAGLLAMRYHKARRTSEAIRILDDLAEAVKTDADELFHLADVYSQLEQKESAGRLLKDVLKLDPQHAQASNYLGYMWAEDGQNLTEAETLIRSALSGDPENAAYLDSLGWVLYKRSHFEEAAKHLQSALKGMEQPDPTVLDHLGDTLYRLNRRDEAAKAWQQALDRLGSEPPGREELAKLKLVLKNKLGQHKAGRPVDVSPVAAAGTQAKN